MKRGTRERESARKERRDTRELSFHGSPVNYWPYNQSPCLVLSAEEKDRERETGREGGDEEERERERHKERDSKPPGAG